MELENTESREPFPSLIDIYNNPPLGGIDCVGVVIDSTWAYRTKEGEDYVTKIKLIDKTLNFETGLNHDKKYLHIFIYSTKDLSPKLVRIGDIFFLKNFSFSKYQGDLNEVKGKRLKKDSCYYVFGYEPSSDSEQLIVQWTDDCSLKIQGYEASYLLNLQRKTNELREWIRIFFSNNSITKMNWFGFESKDLKKMGFKKDFDLLLKIKSIQEAPQASKRLITFTDAKGEELQLQLELDSELQEFAQNDLVKIRSIDRIVGQTITLNTFSSILKLPDFSLDWEKFSAGSSSKNEVARLININSKEVAAATMKELLDLKASISTKKTIRFDTVEHMFYETKGLVIDVAPHRAASIYRKYCTICHDFQDISAVKDNCCMRKMRKMPVYSVFLKDWSIENDPVFLEVLNFPFDDFPNKPLLDLRAAGNWDKNHLSQLDAEIEKRREGLFGESKNYTLLLQPLNDKISMHFRIVEVSLGEKERINSYK